SSPLSVVLLRGARGRPRAADSMPAGLAQGTNTATQDRLRSSAARCPGSANEPTASERYGFRVGGELTPHAHKARSMTWRSRRYGVDGRGRKADQSARR